METQSKQELYKELYDLLKNVDYINLIIDMLADDAIDSTDVSGLTPEQKQASWDVYNQVQGIVYAIEGDAGIAEYFEAPDAK